MKHIHYKSAAVLTLLAALMIGASGCETKGAT